VAPFFFSTSVFFVSRQEFREMKNLGVQPTVVHIPPLSLPPLSLGKATAFDGTFTDPPHRCCLSLPSSQSVSLPLCLMALMPRMLLLLKARFEIGKRECSPPFKSLSFRGLYQVVLKSYPWSPAYPVFLPPPLPYSRKWTPALTPSFLVIVRFSPPLLSVLTCTILT